MLLWGFISTSSVSTSDTLFGAHASPELAEPAGIALALADGDAVLALVAPPFEGPATRDAEVGLSTWIGCMRNQIQMPIQFHSQSDTSASNTHRSTKDTIQVWMKSLTQGQEEQKHGYCCDLAPHG